MVPRSKKKKKYYIFFDIFPLNNQPLLTTVHQRYTIGEFSTNCTPKKLVKSTYWSTGTNGTNCYHWQTGYGITGNTLEALFMTDILYRQLLVIEHSYKLSPPPQKKVEIRKLDRPNSLWWHTLYYLF